MPPATKLIKKFPKTAGRETETTSPAINIHLRHQSPCQGLSEPGRAFAFFAKAATGLNVPLDEFVRPVNFHTDVST